MHNLFYALAQLSNNEIFVKLLGILEGTFFIVAVVVCPVVFVGSCVWIIILSLRNRGEINRYNELKLKFPNTR